MGERQKPGLYIIGPTILMAESVCKLLGLPKKHAVSANGNMLRGLDANNIFFVLSYDAYPWDPKAYYLLMRALDPIGGLVLQLPELTRVARPYKDVEEWRGIGNA